MSARRLGDWIHERTGARHFFQAARRLYHGAAGLDRWSLLGGLLLVLLLLQFGTGTLLLLYYTPDPERAFESVQSVMWDVPFGWLIRLLHVHGASIAIALVVAHLGIVALRGAYKAPRELVWVTGCVLLLLLLAAAVTGYILPWSQLSYWAVTITTGSIGEIPWIGEGLLRLIRGGEAVGAGTLRRAFTAHVVVLPVVMVVLIVAHVGLVFRAGIAAVPGRRGAEPASKASAASAGLDYAIWVVALLMVLLLLVFYASSLGVPETAFEPADPLRTPLDAQAAWYLLWAHQLLRLLPAWLALGVQALLFAAVVALPFLDRGPHRHPRDRPWVTASLVGLVVCLIGLTILGSRS